ncbi:undecaprenyl-diphosphatase UppP [Candidatus Wolfebacteria bacterium]|nr:MAG: undecaprenyl-diphosphatase UppP [Candidatus Wolfebacteria bacterium]
MTIFEAIGLGIVQGITEFLPVSSSGHLIIFRELFGINDEFGLAFDALLHLATLLAVVLYFRKDIFRLCRSCGGYISGKGIDATNKVLGWAIVLGTIPAVVIGLQFEDQIEAYFRTSTFVAWMLIAGSLLFILAELVHKRIAEGNLTVSRGIVAGLFQALALLPGFSRSGATISGGLLAGLNRESAVRFSFLLAIPVIAGGGLLKLHELVSDGGWNVIDFPTVVSAFTAFIVGLGAIHFLVYYLRKHTLMIFVVYRVALALLILILL